MQKLLLFLAAASLHAALGLTIAGEPPSEPALQLILHGEDSNGTSIFKRLISPADGHYHTKSWNIPTITKISFVLPPNSSHFIIGFCNSDPTRGPDVRSLSTIQNVTSALKIHDSEYQSIDIRPTADQHKLCFNNSEEPSDGFRLWFPATSTGLRQYFNRAVLYKTPKPMASRFFIDVDVGQDFLVYFCNSDNRIVSKFGPLNQQNHRPSGFKVEAKEAVEFMDIARAADTKKPCEPK